MNRSPSRPPRTGAALLCALSLAGAARAQNNPSPPAGAASSPATRLDRVEITGGRADDMQQRRRATASKIIVGREEIERYGDSTVGELLKRLPGVTMQGAPGRGGNIRMRGLGSGYTQILLDGERVPPGFSLDSLAPEQIERIEILRAPTAETGARAIAGTINIITREGYRQRLNDLHAGVAVENGHVNPGASWTRNQAIGRWTVNTSLSAYAQRRDSDSATRTVDVSPADGSTALDQSEQGVTHEQRRGLNLSTRLQWRGDKGEALTLSPFLIASHGHSQRTAQLDQAVPDPGVAPPPYDHSTTGGASRFTLMRLNGQWNHRLGDGRLEWHGGLGRAEIHGQSLRNEFDAGADASKRTLADDTAVRDDSANASLKWLRQLDNEHSLVGGAELEGTRRHEAHTTTETTPSQGTHALLDDVGDNFGAGTTRIALYGQDEWSVSPRWAAHAGLRWEAISTRSGADGNSPATRNRSSVWTPIAHAVWKPDPQSRDQLRMSLTRSYRSPTLASLIARPSISSRYPLDGPVNAPTSPDRVGNPELRPELATGIDVAFERYLPGSGLLSASIFHRTIRDLIRTLTTLENPPWASGPRWVARPRNVGDAVTQGFELEAKFRASDLWASAPPLDVRANASVFHSRVKSVPGPDNRLDQQPGGTANLGLDYRLRRVPLTLGGNFNWNPAYSTRLSEDQFAYQGRKRVADAYALWAFQPGLQLRVTASNLAPLDYVTAGTVASETATTTARSYVNWQVRLEAKL